MAESSSTIILMMISPISDIGVRAAHRPSYGYGRPTAGHVMGTDSPSTVCPVVSAKCQRGQTGVETAIYGV